MDGIARATFIASQTHPVSPCGRERGEGELQESTDHMLVVLSGGTVGRATKGFELLWWLVTQTATDCQALQARKVKDLLSGCQ